jgi:uncharacterized phage-associated protein
MLKSLNMTAVDLSKYIVTKCVIDEKPISNLQLQKILYYIQKHFLKNDSIAFSDEIEAWQFGPVVPRSYYRFSGFGAMPITNQYSSISIADGEAKQVVDGIVSDKRTLNPWQMVQETHKPGGAWATIYNNGKGNHQTIPVELIKNESD